MYSDSTYNPENNGPRDGASHRHTRTAKRRSKRTHRAEVKGARRAAKQALRQEVR